MVWVRRGGDTVATAETGGGGVREDDIGGSQGDQRARVENGTGESGEQLRPTGVIAASCGVEQGTCQMLMVAVRVGQ